MARSKPTKTLVAKPIEARRKGGRPPTGHRALPAVRVNPELFAALEDRLRQRAKKKLLASVSFYVRESLREKLRRDLLADRREALKKKAKRK
jgi:hypothetical protein